MKRLILSGILLLSFAAGLSAGDFDAFFEDATLRLDYVFCGNASRQEIYFAEAFRTSGWAGRRTRLDQVFLEGNGQISLSDPETGKILYVNSFSTLFQEWTSYEEATRVNRAFENCFQVPFPKAPVRVTLTLTDHHRKVSARMSHIVDPADILICPLADNGYSRTVLHRGGDLRRACDVVILSEGYTEAERSKFYKDAARTVEALLSHEPFASRRNCFNFTAIAVPSPDSGVSVPHDGRWKRTVASSHFDTFYVDRYLTTANMKDVFDAIGTVPFEHVIVLANTPVYGGGGIFNSVTIMGSDHPTFPRVIVHEFGHAFAGLADEYYYDDMYDPMYPLDTEPWEPNITTKIDFLSKWKDLLDEGKAGLFEGGGYTSKGVFRPAEDCRMKTNSCPDFCPVCTRAINRIIDYYTAEE